MKKVHLGVLVFLLIFLGYLLYDWRNGSAGVIVDGVLVPFFATFLVKKLLDRPSESERQREVWDQGNHR